MYVVRINNISYYENKVPLQIAFDFILHKSKQYKKAGKGFSASIMDNETGELVYVTNSYIS